MYRRSVFEKIGRFDEAHFAYLEDIDVGYRARSMAMRTGTVRGQSYGMSEVGRADQDTMSLKYAILRETMFI